FPHRCNLPAMSAAAFDARSQDGPLDTASGSVDRRGTRDRGAGDRGPEPQRDRDPVRDAVSVETLTSTDAASSFPGGRVGRPRRTRGLATGPIGLSGRCNEDRRDRCRIEEPPLRDCPRTRTPGTHRNPKGWRSHLMNIIAWIILGAIAGYLAGFLVRGDEGLGVIGHIVLGIVGALVGGFLAGVLFNSHPIDGPFDLSLLVVATIGAIITVVGVNAVTGRSRSGRGAVCPGSSPRSPSSASCPIGTPAFPGGRSDSHPPNARRALMSQITEAIDVQVPVRTAYDQWTQFETFPKFMEGVKSVRQLDDTTVHWVAEIAGREKSWDAKITEQRPDERISWTATNGAHNAGVVTFHRLGEGQSRVTLQLDVEPEGPIETVGDALGVVKNRVKGDMERFKEFIEKRGTETGAWRGEGDHASH